MQEVVGFKRLEVDAKQATSYARWLGGRRKAYPGSKAEAKQARALKRAEIDAGLAQGRLAEARHDAEPYEVMVIDSFTVMEGQVDADARG